MKIQRMLLVVALTGFFAVCFTIMNQQYDPLARYPYATEQNRDEILANVTKQDIQVMIDEDIKPEEFMPFMTCDDFQMEDAKLYHQISLKVDETPSTIVSFVTQARSVFSPEMMLVYLDSYTFSDLIDWVNYRDRYNKDGTLILNPTKYDTVLSETDGVGRYTPADLVAVTAMPSSISEGTVRVNQETHAALETMCSLMETEFGSKCGGLIALQGYLSFEDQQKLYDKMLVQYGQESIVRYFRYPGHNEYQLGNTVDILAVGTTKETFSASKQYAWLIEHAHESGFVFRYPSGKEELTGFAPQSWKLRYVGTDLASYMHANQLSLEEVNIQK